MSKRSHNILFHTHTISGIIISVVLYIIFFAGSFSFFRDEIINWEQNKSLQTGAAPRINFKKTIESLEKNYNLDSRDLNFSWKHREPKVNISIGASKDSLATAKDKEGDYIYIDSKTYQISTYESSYSFGEFLYRLHFLAQIPYPVGYYLAGFVAFFFLFAIITGVIVHWKKMVSNFYVFRPWSKLKTLWADAHTALGLIGLPFQFVYAVTGAFFMIKLVLVAPSLAVLYNGDQDKMYEELGFNDPEYDFNNQKLNKTFNIDALVKKTNENWDDFKSHEVHISNYNDTNMHVTVIGETTAKAKLNGLGSVTYNIATNKVIKTTNPYHKTSYLDTVKNVLYRLHYGDYGGYGLKFISFILGLISCFVIISGVLLWQVARNNKTVSEQKRKFNKGLVNIYLAICLSMYPITAATFIAIKIWQPTGKEFLYPFYFIGWLVLSIFYIVKNNLSFTNRNTLLLGSILGFLIPISNGVFSNNWIWHTYANQQYDLVLVDMLWIVLSIVSFYVWLVLKRKKNEI